MIDFLFAGINGVLFFGGATYFFIKRGLPVIRAQMQLEETRYSLLLHETDALKNKNEQLQKTLLEQEELYKDLAHKVAEWRTRVIAQQRENHHAHEQRLHLLRESYNARAERIAALKVEQQLAREVLVEVTEELKQYYAHDQYNVAYVARVIDVLREMQ